MTPLDRIDFEILAALQKDGRLSNKELAASVGLAPSSALERTRRLREAGVLGAVTARIDPAAVGIGLQALIAIRLARHAREVSMAFRAYIAALPEVIAVYHVSGIDDFLIHVAVRDSEHLRDLVLDAISSRAEVGRHQTNLIFDVTHSPLPIYRAG
jgi:DNA-binding Lrp family transcriptional regulator